MLDTNSTSYTRIIPINVSFYCTHCQRIQMAGRAVVVNLNLN
jgi:hypothetical protein